VIKKKRKLRTAKAPRHRKSKRNTLSRKLSKLGYTNYWEYLNSSHWKAFKKAYYTKFPKRCMKCKSITKLNLHHKTYIRLGKENFTDVKCLCENCHEKTH
jgi:hypothetical protein